MAENKAVNLDHNTGTIYTTGDSVVRVGTHGCLKVGDGENVSGNLESQAGAIKFVKGTTFTDSYYAMSNGTKFQKLVQEADSTASIIYSIIFG